MASQHHPCERSRQPPWNANRFTAQNQSGWGDLFVKRNGPGTTTRANSAAGACNPWADRSRSPTQEAAGLATPPSPWLAASFTAAACQKDPTGREAQQPNNTVTAMRRPVGRLTVALSMASSELTHATDRHAANGMSSGTRSGTIARPVPGAVLVAQAPRATRATSPTLGATSCSLFFGAMPPGGAGSRQAE